jgi:molybdopterin-guanine dinucleotide biosynthesis protein A
VTGVILAGGKSSRLGQDKAHLRLDGTETLAETAVRRLASLVDEVIVVGDVERLGALPARVIPDLYPGAGTLGGIYAGLAAARRQHSLVVGCDMPFLSAALLGYMIAQPREYDVLLPRLADGMFEPLHALYSRNCLAPIRDRLESRQYRIVGFLGEVRVRYLDEPEMRRHDPELRSFLNVNTPDDLRRAVEIYRSGLARTAEG